MDGLLLDTERLCLKTFIATGAEFGLDQSVDLHATFLKCIGHRADKSDAIIAKALGDALPIKTFTKAWDALLVDVFGMGIPVKTGAMEMLTRLAEKDVPVAVATSTRTARALEHLEDVGLLPLIQVVVGGEQVTNPKPAPEIYHKAAEMLGLRAAHCVAFEDSDTGTTAAVHSGARTVQVPDLKAPSAEVRKMGHIIAPDLLTGARQAGLPV